MSLQVPVDIETEIEALARRRGEPATQLLREALLAYLEDVHDAELAAKRLSTAGERRTLNEIGSRYGLVD